MEDQDGVDTNSEVDDCRMDDPTMAMQGSDAAEGDLRTPLLPVTNDDPNSHRLIRQRGNRIVNGEGGTMMSSRILDRSGAFRQSRGHWSVHRLSRQAPSLGNRCCPWCFRGRIWSEWNLGGWFHRLAYQRTGVLMLILFCTYATIVLFFAIVYLTVSKIGRSTDSNPDGSERVVPYCQMEINNKMEALYLSLSTMASIGYGGSFRFMGLCNACRLLWTHSFAFRHGSLQLLFR